MPPKKKGRDEQSAETVRNGLIPLQRVVPGEHDAMLQSVAAGIPQDVITAVRDLEDFLECEVGDDYLVGDLHLRALDCHGEGRLPLPIPMAAAQEFAKEKCNPAVCGMEGRGDKVRPEIRRCREALLSGPDSVAQLLPSNLTDFNRHYPEVLSSIRNKLAPSCAEVTAEPYKVIAYGKGDFFATHVDSMSSKDHIGSMVVLLPVEIKDSEGHATVCETSQEREPDLYDLSYPGKHVVPCGASWAPSTKSRFDDVMLPGDAVSGELRFYPCRMASKSVADSLAANHTIRPYDVVAGVTENSYMVSRYSEMKVGRINLACPATAAGSADGGCDTQFAAWLGDVPHEVSPIVDEDHLRIVVSYKLFARGSADGTASSEVISGIRSRFDHVVSQLDGLAPKTGLYSSYPVDLHVKTTAEIREKEEEDRQAAARRLAAAEEVRRQKTTWRGYLSWGAGQVLSGAKWLIEQGNKRRGWEMKSIWRNVDDVRHAAGVRHVAFVLRHMYPPAGLEPAHLKGLDALVHQALAPLPGVNIELLSVCEIHNDYISSPFRQRRSRLATLSDEERGKWRTQRQGNSAVHAEENIERQAFEEDQRLLLRKVFATADRLTEKYKDCGVEEGSLEAVYANEDLVTNCIWVELGFGELLGGGHCLGNWDCPTAWWYRHAAMIVTVDP